MARPQAADYERRRDLILTHAAALFAARGFHAASIADIAAASGTSKSLVYHYYASKEALLHDVMAGHVEALSAAAEAVAASPAPPSERLAALTHAFLALYAGAATRQKVLLNDLDKLPPTPRAAIVERQRRIIAVVEAIVAELAPALAPDRPRRRAAAMLVLGAINWTHTWYDPAGPVAPPELAAMATDLALGGIARLSA